MTANKNFHMLYQFHAFLTITLVFEWALCTAALLPELKPAPCFLSAIIGPID